MKKKKEKRIKQWQKAGFTYQSAKRIVEAFDDFNKVYFEYKK